jgi:hypothetical protein
VIDRGIVLLQKNQRSNSGSGGHACRGKQSWVQNLVVGVTRQVVK